jgi:hypothetical protein
MLSEYDVTGHVIQTFIEVCKVKLPDTRLSLTASNLLNRNAFVVLNFIPSQVKDIPETVENKTVEDEMTDSHNPLKALTMTATNLAENVVSF